MGASIECRVPFLDFRLVEGLAALPSSVLNSGHQSKILLRRSVGDRLPEAVQKYRKWGFAVPWSKTFERFPNCATLFLPCLIKSGSGRTFRPRPGKEFGN